MSRSLEQINPSPPLGGRYKIISELGAGGFGQTFLAQDLHLPGHPKCVVKQLKPQTNDPNSLAMARRLFDTEAQVLYQLGDHDQIPRLLAHFEDNEQFYLAQELIEGEPLTQEIAGGQPWTEVQAIALMQDILQVLAFVHHKQVIHRDIKPPNLIRRRSDGKIVLIDFGAVKQVSTQVVNLDAGQTNLTISIGTKGYMPNEQIAGKPRFSSDVYAVGMVGIRALTGIHPKRLGEDPKTGEITWHARAPHVSPELAALIDKMVCYDFRDRYPTAIEALLALRSLPAALLESLPEPDLYFEEPETEATPSQVLPSSPTILESTVSEIETEYSVRVELTDYTESGINRPSTQIWVPTEAPEQIVNSTNGTNSTEPLSEHLTEHEPTYTTGISAPGRITLELIGRRLVRSWSVVAILAIAGTTVLMALPHLFPHLTNYTNSTRPVPIPSGSTPTATPTISPQKLPPEELLSQGDRLREAGKYQEALSFYDQAIALKPNNQKLAKAYWGRCYSLNELQKPTEAKVSCNDALALKPDYPEALWSKGKAIEQEKLEREDPEEPIRDALEYYQKATKLKPDLADAWVDRGVALQKLGRSWEANDALDKGIKLKRDSALAWSTKGEALANLGLLKEAIDALDKALQLQPNDLKVIELRQRVQEELKR